MGKISILALFAPLGGRSGGESSGTFKSLSRLAFSGLQLFTTHKPKSDKFGLARCQSVTC